MAISVKSDIKSTAKILDRIIERNELQFNHLHNHNLTRPAIIDYAMMTPAEFLIKIANEKTVILQEKDISNNTILHYAAKLGNYELVKYLIEKNDSINVQNIYGKTPLSSAIIEGHTEIVKILLDAGSDLNEVENHKNIFEDAKDEIKELLIKHDYIKPIDYEEKSLETMILTIGQINKLHIIQDNCMERPTITHNIHYMWLTDPENPIEAPLSHLTYVTN